MQGYWRVQNRQYALTDSSVSWPWGLSRGEAEEAGQVLDGVSCCESACALYDYFTARGGVDDEMAYVVHFQGRERGSDGEADIAQFVREIERIEWSEFARRVESGAYDEE